MKFLDKLASRRRFGMKPGLDTIRAVCAALGDPQESFKAIHVAGTNGKGAVAAMIAAALASTGGIVGRYTSPHLVRLNERFFLDGHPIADATLDAAAERVNRAITNSNTQTPERPNTPKLPDLTFFEALTAVAFLVYAEAKAEHVVLETGLGGRLDATNVCVPELCVITKIGLDHCDWLGDTVEKIAAEKSGIIKPGVPVVLAKNEPSVCAVVENRAKAVGAPFHYAPDLATADEIPADFPLSGSFNRENAVTALAALKVLGAGDPARFADVVWPGRFQLVGDFIVDGAHNPPACQALVQALQSEIPDLESCKLDLIAGFCGDKDAGEVLRMLSPFVKRGFAVRTNNPRSLFAEETAAKMRAAGIDAVACPSLRTAIDLASARSSNLNTQTPKHLNTIICGSLFLAGEALVELGAYPWPAERFDPSELLKV